MVILFPSGCQAAEVAHRLFCAMNSASTSRGGLPSKPCHVEPIGKADCREVSSKQDLRAVWRPLRIVAKRRDFALESRTPEGRDHVNSTVPFLRAVGDVFAVGRPVRLPVLARPFRDLNRIAAADLLDPDVELSAAVGTVGDVAAVGRPGCSGLQALVEGQPSEGALNGRRGEAAGRNFW